MARILVTGAAGFLGRHLIGALAQDTSSEILGLVRSKPTQMHPRVCYLVGDVRDPGWIDEATSNVETVIHLAALTSHQDIVDNSAESLRVSLEGTRQLIEALLRRNTQHPLRFIYASSGKVYGSQTRLPIEETAPCRPTNLLGKSKLLTEQLIDYYVTAHPERIQATLLRIFNVYGAHQKSQFLIPTILSQLNKNKTQQTIQLGDIQAKRDYIYIDDVVEAFQACLTCPWQAGTEIYNLCSGIPASAKEVTQHFSEILKTPIEIETDPTRFRKDEQDIEYGSYKKAQKHLSWTPTTTLKQGLGKTFSEWL